MHVWSWLAQKSFIGQDNDENFEHKIEKKINSFKEDQIIYKEFTDNIHEYYQTADMFVFLSREEGMPNALLEAMSCGLPCLITPFEGLSSEFGKSGNHYRLTSHNVNHVYEDISDMLNDENANFLGKNAHENIIENLSASTCVEKLIKKLALSH